MQHLQFAPSSFLLRAAGEKVHQLILRFLFLAQLELRVRLAQEV